MVSDHRKDIKYISTGFSYWNDGFRRLHSHERTNSHKDSITALENLEKSGMVDEMLDKTVKANKIDAHDMLAFVIEAIRYLSRQGLPMRGSYDKDSPSFTEPDSNLWQVLQSYARISDRLQVLLQRTHTYTSPEVQNELLTIMSQKIQRDLVQAVKKAKWYCLMLDETPDISGKEQLAICFR